MRVAMLARTLPIPEYAGGVSGQVHLLATAMQRRGVDVTVFAQNEPPAGSPYGFEAVGRHSQASGRVSSLYLFPWWASKLRLDDYDVVHSHGDDHLLRTKRPVVRTFYGSAKAETRHATTARHRAYHLSMVVPELLSERRASVRVAISAAARSYLSRPAVVIPCAYDPAVFFPSGDKSARPSILFVGDLGTRKRAELLLNVFATRVRPAVPEAELWLVTAKPIAAPGVRWFGRVTTGALADLYRQAWLFCLPSRYEGFGVPYIEALACGTPVVATPNGGAEEVLSDGGRVVCDADVGDALVDLLRNHDARQSLAREAAAHVCAYQIDRIAERYADIYQRAAVQSPDRAVGDRLQTVPWESQ